MADVDVEEISKQCEEIGRFVKLLLDAAGRNAELRHNGMHDRGFNLEGHILLEGHNIKRSIMTIREAIGAEEPAAQRIRVDEDDCQEY